MKYGRDTRTRWEGIYARHAVGCGVEKLPRGPSLTQISRACKCSPAYWGKGWDRAESKHVKTKMYPTSSAARHARKALLELIEKGGVPTEASLRLRDARPRFIADAKAGRALNKKGKKFTTKAITSMDGALRVHVEPPLGPRPIGDIHKRDIQKIVDDLAPRLSGSRVRAVVNGVHSMYTWARQRDLASHDPGADIILPALDAKPRERIATPKELAALLSALEPSDALPYALAAYSWARASQIQWVLWEEVDLELGLIEWGVEEDGARKSEAARHVVPLLKPVWKLLKEAWIEQGRPSGERHVCPPIKNSKTGLLSTGSLAKRAAKAWEKAKLQPIGLQECRHTAASWLDPAGVSPKTASVLMAHSAPDRQPGAAPITLARYTHLMPDALETARKQMNLWLVAQVAKEVKAAAKAAAGK